MKSDIFLSKEDWNIFLENDQDCEFIGYILATQGFQAKLRKALKIENLTQFKQAIRDLVEDRADFIEHVHETLDARAKVFNLRSEEQKRQRYQIRKAPT